MVKYSRAYFSEVQSQSETTSTPCPSVATYSFGVMFLDNVIWIICAPCDLAYGVRRASSVRRYSSCVPSDCDRPLSAPTNIPGPKWRPRSSEGGKTGNKSSKTRKRSYLNNVVSDLADLSRRGFSGIRGRNIVRNETLHSFIFRSLKSSAGEVIYN